MQLFKVAQCCHVAGCHLKARASAHVEAKSAAEIAKGVRSSMLWMIGFDLFPCCGFDATMVFTLDLHAKFVALY